MIRRIRKWWFWRNAEPMSMRFYYGLYKYQLRCFLYDYDETNIQLFVKDNGMKLDFIMIYTNDALTSDKLVLLDDHRLIEARYLDINSMWRHYIMLNPRDFHDYNIREYLNNVY